MVELNSYVYSAFSLVQLSCALVAPILSSIPVMPGIACYYTGCTCSTVGAGVALILTTDACLYWVIYTTFPFIELKSNHNKKLDSLSSDWGSKNGQITTCTQHESIHPKLFAVKMYSSI